MLSTFVNVEEEPVPEVIRQPILFHMLLTAYLICNFRDTQNHSAAIDSAPLVRALLSGVRIGLFGVSLEFVRFSDEKKKKTLDFHRII